MRRILSLSLTLTLSCLLLAPICGPSDRDGDGIPDSEDNCPNAENTDQSDLDGDNVGDVCDNCPEDPNPVQGDIDDDGLGDICDNCAASPNPEQEDCDGDGEGDVCDPEGDRDEDGDGTCDPVVRDTDNDGVIDDDDNCPDAPNPNQEDCDNDGFGDICDLECDRDTNGDGVCDVPSGISFANEVETIFSAHCGTCHLNGNASGGLNLDPGNAYGNLVDVPSTQAPLDRVEPGDPQASYLWHKLLGTQDEVGGSGAQMPRGRSPLGGCDLRTIRIWIEEGALDN